MSAAGSSGLPRVELRVGAGAAAAGCDPDQLVVDASGRWQADASGFLLQSVDQFRELRDLGFVDPYQFGSGPRDRLPVDAVCYWQGSILAQCRVINGWARLRNGGGRVLAEIAPADGSAPITVEPVGRTVIATGMPPEVVPGVNRRLLTLPRTLRQLDAELAMSSNQDVQIVRREIDGLRWDDPASAGRALAILRAHAIGSSSPYVMESLTAFAAWQDACEAHQGGPPRVLFGDDARLRGFDPEAAKRWLVVGFSDSSAGAAEAVLSGCTTATVTMVGGAVSDDLLDDDRWVELRQAHDRRFNPKHPESGNLAASGRLTVLTERPVGRIQQVVAPGGVMEYAVADARGDGYIACLGGRDRLPPAVTELVERALRDDPSSVTAQILFNHDGQYLCYRLTVAGHELDVTGAASRFLPGAPLFTAPDTEQGYQPQGRRDIPGWKQIWSTTDPRFVTLTAARRDAPRESAHTPSSYVPTVVQAVNYRAATRKT